MRTLILGSLWALLLPAVVAAADLEGAADHPVISRYPGSEIAWYEVDNQRPYKLAVGPVTGYRAIADWIETEGRVTRIYYTLDDSERTEHEVYVNYRQALEDAGFEILAAGSSEAGARGGEVGTQTGLVTVDAEAIGRDLEEKGRVVLDGLFFDHDQATLTDASGPTLEQIVLYLKANPERRFHVVGHTDARGELSYNLNLSRDRARAVVTALAERHGVWSWWNADPRLATAPGPP